MGVKVYMDGTLCDPEDATISVFDRGFLYGDSVYEVLRTYDGRPYAVDEHLERLYTSARTIGFEPPWSSEHLRSALAATLRAARNPESYVRIVCTRGSGEIGLDPRLASDPHLIVIAKPLPQVPVEQVRDGIAVAIVSVMRNPSAAIPPSAKSGNYLNNILALQEAKQRGAFDAIMLDLHGKVAEGSSSNVFVVRGGAVCTPPLEVGILDGITRRALRAICATRGIPYSEEALVPADLYVADEMFLSSSIREVIPVVRCDDRVIGGGRPGPLTVALMAAYRAFAAQRASGA